MRRILLAATLLFAFFVMGFPVHGETLEMEDPDWREVPGTEPPSEEFFAAFFETNGLLRHGNTRVFDMIDPQMYYFRVEVDRYAKRHRVLRKGTFETKTRIQYEALGDSSWEASRDVMREGALFACSR